MLKPIKITHPEHDIWVISDLHIGHNREFLYGPRQFKSVEEHDSAIIQRWNAHLTHRSVCFHLGDTIFADPDGGKFKSLMRRLNFSVLYCCWGNHFSGQLAVYKEVLASRFSDAVEDGQLLYEVYPLEYLIDGNPHKKVVFCPSYIEASIGGHRFVMSHYPIISHNKMAKGSVHLTGHSHGNLALTNKDTGSGMRLDVGVNSFGRPISITEIKRHLAGRSLDARDHHGEEPE